MSKDSYSKWWIKSKYQLKELQDLDNLTRKTTKKTNNRYIANNLIGNVYGRYCIMVQNLDACVDQLCHVQKGVTMRKLMDAAMYRLNELRNDFLKIDFSEFHYIDGNLVELKLIPHEVEILYPSLVFPRPNEIQEMWEKLKRGDTIYIPPSPSSPEFQALAKKKKKKEKIDPIAAMLEAKEKQQQEQQQQIAAKSVMFVEPTDNEGQAEAPESEEVAKDKEEKKPKFRKPKAIRIDDNAALTPEELEALRKKEIISRAVQLLQIHEKARQARLYYGDLDLLRRLRKKKKKKEERNVELDEQSATTIQKYWRGYTARQSFKQKEIKRRLLIGMTEPSWISKEDREKFKKNIEKRRELREQRYREYIKANLEEKERVLRVIGPGLMEDIGDEIREWFHEWYIVAKCFDKYPDEEVGGTVLVIRFETITPEHYLAELEKKKKEKKKSPADKKKEKEAKLKAKKAAKDKLKKEKAKAKRDAAIAKKREMKGEFNFQFPDTEVDKIYDAGFKEEFDLWDHRPDSENPNDAPYMDMITNDKCCEMQLELRKQVDELMRVELEMLNQALAKDKKKKYKKPKKKKKKKKGKKGKKDPTANRKIEDLFQELVQNNIIRQYPSRSLDEFKGDFSYANWDKRMMDFDPLQRVGDVRHAVVMNCIMPIGVETMPKPKSVLIAGPRQCGKHLLADAIFTATRCMLFDLSPENILGKYPGKKALNLLVHKVDKMSKILQPSIIYFDAAEKPFYKKVPKNEKSLEPKRLGGSIFKKLVKPIQPQDRVLVLGITNQPWAAKAKGLSKAFEKIILIPRTDYGSVYLYWRELLMPYHGIDRDLNVSTLAKLTVNYPFSELRKATQELLTAERIISLKNRPLQFQELYEILIKKEPVTDKEFQKFTKWYDKTPLGKRRNVINKLAEKRREQAAKIAEKMKKKK